MPTSTSKTYPSERSDPLDIISMTPDPKGFPRSSPLANFVPSKPLTDKRIADLCLSGYYGSARQQLASAIERGRKIFLAQKRQKAKTIQQAIDDLLK
jgi:hypothetical protein